MPMQQQNSSFAGRLGSRVAQANAEHKDKPIDTGDRRLPPGIRKGRAKLSAMYTKQQTEANGSTPVGETFFRASAIVEGQQVGPIFTVEHNGVRIAGMVTQTLIPLCDVPARGKSKAKTFSENWFKFQNLFKLLGVAPPNETPQTDPTGQRTEAYYFAAMKMLVERSKSPNPVYIEFSTRGWTPTLTPQEIAAGQKAEERVQEEWHGLWKDEVKKPDPATSVNLQTNGVTSPPVPFEEPPRGVQYPDSPPADAPQMSMEDEVAALVEVAMSDPNGETPDGADASKRLEDLAWKNGWTKEHTSKAADWAAVGDMALNPPREPKLVVSPTTGKDPEVGAKYKFAKRTKDGSKLKNNKGEEFPPQEVEVTTVDVTNKTVLVKTTKDDKMVVDIKSRQPVAVKWEWLE